MLPWLRRLVGGRALEQITAALRRRDRRYRLADERFEQREQGALLAAQARDLRASHRRIALRAQQVELHRRASRDPGARILLAPQRDLFQVVCGGEQSFDSLQAQVRARHAEQDLLARLVGAAVRRLCGAARDAGEEKAFRREQRWAFPPAADAGRAVLETVRRLGGCSG